jgi:hypothetical protein
VARRACSWPDARVTFWREFLRSRVLMVFRFGFELTFSVPSAVDYLVIPLHSRETLRVRKPQNEI